MSRWKGEADEKNSDLGEAVQCRKESSDPSGTNRKDVRWAVERQTEPVNEAPKRWLWLDGNLL